MWYGGAVAVVGQTILLRELMASFYGTEFVLGAVLGCWLIFVPLGAITGGLAVRWISQKALPLLLCCFGAGIFLPSQFIVARLVRQILPFMGFWQGGAAGFVPMGLIIFGAAISAGPLSFWVGFLFPVACEWEGEISGTEGRVIGRVYIAEALGSCAAGCALSFVLLSCQSPVSIVVLSAGIWLSVGGIWAFAPRWRGLAGLSAIGLGICWLIVAILTRGGAKSFAIVLSLWSCIALLLSWRTRTRYNFRSVWGVALLGAGCLSGLFLLLFSGALREWSLKKRWSTFSSFNLVESMESRYQHIDLGERESMWEVRLDGVRSGVFPDELDTMREAATLLTQHPDPRSILVIGEGLGGLCQDILHAGDRKVDYVGIDPLLISVYRQHLPEGLIKPLRSPAFAAFACDGRHFLREIREDSAKIVSYAVSMGPNNFRTTPAAPYDIVLVNLGDPTSVADNRYFTREFFRGIRGVLSDKGVVAVWSLSGDSNYLEGPVLRYNASFFRTLREVFPRVIVQPGESYFRYFGGGVGMPTDDPDILKERFDRLGLKPQLMRYMFENEVFRKNRVQYVRSQLVGAVESAEVNTNQRPVGWTLYLAVWEDSISAGLAARDEKDDVRDYKFFESVQNVSPLVILVPIGVTFFILLVGSFVRPKEMGKKTAGAFSILTTGVFGLSANMLVIYTYQAYFGYVYRDISVIAGTFMAGLAIGARIAERAKHLETGKLLMFLEGTQIVFLLSFPVMSQSLSGHPILLILLSPVAGILTGAEFPLACYLSSDSSARVGTTASLFDASDHLGALIGAALTGLVLMPAFGVKASGIILAGVKMFSLFLLLIVRSKYRGIADLSL